MANVTGWQGSLVQRKNNDYMTIPSAQCCLRKTPRWLRTCPQSQSDWGTVMRKLANNLKRLWRSPHCQKIQIKTCQQRLTKYSRKEVVLKHGRVRMWSVSLGLKLRYCGAIATLRAIPGPNSALPQATTLQLPGILTLCHSVKIREFMAMFLQVW